MSYICCQLGGGPLDRQSHHLPTPHLCKRHYINPLHIQEHHPCTTVTKLKSPVDSKIYLCIHTFQLSITTTTLSYGAALTPPPPPSLAML